MAHFKCPYERNTESENSDKEITIPIVSVSLKKDSGANPSHIVNLTSEIGFDNLARDHEM